MEDLIREFLEVIDLERNYSPYTVKSYKVNLNQFQQWYIDYGVDSRFALTSPVIRDFVHFLRDEREVCDRSIQQKIATLKSFTGFIRTVLPKNQTQSIAVISWSYKTTKKLKQSLPEDELTSLLLAMENHRAELQTQLEETTGKTKKLKKQINNCYRNRIILLLMVGAGMRVGEVCKLNLKDINMADRSIRVVGKGAKEREVYFDIPEMIKGMDAYLTVREALSPQSDALFINSRDGGRLTVRSVELMFKKYLSRAGIDDKHTPHSLRHTFATLSIERGANIKAVSQILGHSQVRTTLSLYTHLSEGHVRKVFRMCHPLSSEKLSDREIVDNRRNSLIYINDETNHWQRKAISNA